MLSHNIVDIARSLLTHWPGLLLVCLSVLTFTSIIIIGVALILPKQTGGLSTIHSASACLKFTSNTAPTVGLLGTIYGLLRSFLSAKPEDIPHYVGIALQTTYIGGILFLICVFFGALTDYFSRSMGMSFDDTREASHDQK